MFKKSKNIKYFIFGLILLVIAFNYSKIKLGYIYYVSPCYYGEPIKQNHFPQVFLEVNLEKYYAELNSLAAAHFKIDTLETIQYKNREYPVLDITKKTEKIEVSKKLLIVAGVHGNESGGTLAVLQLLKRFNLNPNKFRNWEVKIISPVNPVGTLEMSRYNQYGCDLNRKFESSTEKGVLLQKNTIDSFEPDVIINMHEAPSEGFLIHTNQFIEDDLLFKLLKEVEEQGIQLATEDYFGRKLAVKGNSKIDGTLKFLNKLVQVQSLGDYASEKNIIEITTESGWNSKDKFQRINSHVLLILSVIENYN